jgi:hypothetical protein
MARPVRWLGPKAFTALCAGALLVGCTYSPDLKNGSLQCSSDGKCPRGYTCLQQLCCLPGDPTCGGALGPPDVSRYVGVWTFTSASTLDTECQGQAPGGPAAFLTMDNPVSTMTITDTGNGTLNAVWSEWSNCPYKLSVDGTGAHGTEAATWRCSFDYAVPASTNPPQTSAQAWTYQSFGIVSTGAKTATHDGHYSRVDSYSDGSTVQCTQTLHALMIKP